MDHANEVLLLVAALVAVPSLVAGTMYWTHRRGVGVVKGWGGALFILLCWIAALGLILYRTAH
jgi:hypothetical protein